MSAFKLAAPILALALGASAGLIEPRQASATTSSAAGATASATSSAAAAPAVQTPGFMNNGTVGSYPCAVDFNPLAYSPFSVPGCANAQPPVYPFNAISLRAPDDSIRASFVPYGASVHELWVRDRFGNFRDIILSFDNTTNLGTDVVHPNFGPVVGRYANRIKNGTFELNGKTYHTPLNENNFDTLHGGKVGYDRSSFVVANYNSSWIQFTHFDPDGNQGFPGNVNSTIDYYLENGATWRIAMSAVADQETPIMLSSHDYWNLDAFNETESILNYTMHMPQLTQYVATDPELIPTGPLPSVDGTPFDFRKPTVLSDLFNQTTGVCGNNCTGWDSCFINGNKSTTDTAPVFEIWSPASGIKMSVSTDQTAMQVYTCPGIYNANTGVGLPRKRAHGGSSTDPSSTIYNKTTCFVFEAESLIDAINNPSWNVSQIYGPSRPYTWNAAYTFSAVNPDGSAAAPVAAPAASADVPAPASENPGQKSVPMAGSSTTNAASGLLRPATLALAPAALAVALLVAA